MLKSMTGFGRGTVIAEGRELTVELKGVNHKFLDLNFRMLRTLSYLEDSIKGVISQRFARGHIDISVTYKNTCDDTKNVTINKALVSRYIETGKWLEAECGLRNDMSVMSVLRLPEVVLVEEGEDDADIVINMAVEATEKALCELIAMREREGQRLKADFITKINEIAHLRDELVLVSPSVAEESAKKLALRIEKLMPEGIPVDEARLAAEIAILADKACVDEELVRIKTHLENLTAMLDMQEPVGRKADFLIQELNREFNTTGSKSTDSRISSLVIAGKAEIEKLREQIQNIE